MIARQVPLLVTVTQEHVVWIDVDEGDDADDMIASWKEEPYDLNLNTLTQVNADNLNWTVEDGRSDPLVRHDWIGPRFESGAFDSAEEERYQDFMRRRPERKDQP